MLTAERLRELLHYNPETGIWTWLAARRNNSIHAGSVAGFKSKRDGYCRIVVDGRCRLAHRLALLWMNGVWPDAEVDHVNMDRGDNRRQNLRSATRGQNRRNIGAFKNSWTGVKGVTLRRRRGQLPAAWFVNIWADGKQRHRICHGSLEDAANLYADLAQKFHGEFARTE